MIPPTEEQRRMASVSRSRVYGPTPGGRCLPPRYRIAEKFVEHYARTAGTPLATMLLHLVKAAAR